MKFKTLSYYVAVPNKQTIRYGSKAKIKLSKRQGVDPQNEKSKRLLDWWKNLKVLYVAKKMKMLDQYHR